jgi:hypothetical protein
MVLTTTYFALGSQLLYFSTDLENKTCFGITIQAIHFLLFDDFYFQNAGNIQVAFFRFFYA